MRTGGSFSRLTLWLISASCLVLMMCNPRHTILPPEFPGWCVSCGTEYTSYNMKKGCRVVDSWILLGNHRSDVYTKNASDWSVNKIHLASDLSLTSGTHLLPFMLISFTWFILLVFIHYVAFGPIRNSIFFYYLVTEVSLSSAYLVKSI